MNFCTKCASYYQQPGTCNCYASVKPFLAPGHKPWVPQEQATDTPYVRPSQQTGDSIRTNPWLTTRAHTTWNPGERNTPDWSFTVN